MKVDLDRVRDDLTKIEAEIAESEHMLAGLTAQMALLQGKKTDLETFLRMAEEYRQGPAPTRQPTAERSPLQTTSPHQTPQAASRTRLIVRAIEQSPTPVAQEDTPAAQEDTPAAQEDKRVRLPPSTPMILKRIPDKRQTKIALRLAQAFGPDDTITAVDAQSRLGSILDNRSNVTRVHYVSSFLAREADAKNGVLLRLESGKYKLRPDVDLAELTAPAPPPSDTKQASSSV